MTRDAHTRVIGYFASSSPLTVACDGDACVVAGSETAMRRYLKLTSGDGGAGARIRKTRFGEIVAGLQLGGAYAFDQAAYGRLRPLVEREGVHLAPHTFPDPDLGSSPTGVCLVRIQAADAVRCELGGTTPKARWWHRWS